MNDSAQRIEAVRNIINHDCIARVPVGSKELPAMGGSGYYGWQFYLRRAVLDPDCLQVICDDFWDKFEADFKSNPFQLAGVESAAVPIITALVLDGLRRGHRLHAFTIRKERKTYGKRNLIEGIPSPDPVLFIDDLTSPQHNAFWHAIQTLNQTTLKLYPRGYVFVLKKKKGEPRTIVTSMGTVSIESLFTLSDFNLSYEDYQAYLSGNQKA